MRRFMIAILVILALAIGVGIDVTASQTSRHSASPACEGDNCWGGGGGG